MESYQVAKMPPPVPPKYRKVNLPGPEPDAYQTQSDSFDRVTAVAAAATDGTLIQTSGLRVKIRINPENGICGDEDYRVPLRSNDSHLTQVQIKVTNGDALAVSAATPACTDCNQQPLLTPTNLINAFTSGDSKSSNSIRFINPAANSYHHCGGTSGQSSPSDNLDSGTCSDVDAGTPPYSSPTKATSGKGSQFGVAAHQRSASLNSSGIGVDSDVDDDASCDSIDSSEYNADSEHTLPIISAAILKCNGSVVPQPAIPSVQKADCADQRLVQQVESLQLTSGKRRRNGMGVRFQPEEPDSGSNDLHNDTDRFLHFHLNENRFDQMQDATGTSEDDSFAGFKSLIEKSTPAATIRSAKGTVRGVKNRVRAGIATFLNSTATKTWQEKEAGKVVVYTTTMGIVRETYHRCLKVRQILRTHLIKFEEKDVFMSREVQKEIRERMNADQITVPQVFVEGIHVGDAETIDRLNESGELRQILKPYKSADALSTCQVCGGYRLLPCNLCNGSKKSIHRNHFTTELVTLKCMNCDEVGLIRCYAC